MKQHLVTVVIPSYNHSKYIEKAIVSVFEQTYNNIELIVIDDGSTDESNKIISELANNYKFQYIHRENKGLIKTLNEALDLAHGKYFTMLGSDDYFDKYKIEKQVEFFEQNKDCALCYGNVTYINRDDKVLKKGKTKHFKSGYIFKDLLFKNFIPLPSVMIKTAIVREVGGFDERFFLEDYPLWLKIAKNYKIGFIKDSLTFYRLHDTNVSSNLIRMIKEVEAILKDWQDEPEYKKSINKLYLRWFNDLSKTDMVNEAKEYMYKSIKTSFYKPKFIKSFIRYVIKRYI